MTMEPPVRPASWERTRHLAGRIGVGLWLIGLYAFLYVPLLTTVVFSFSESRVQTFPWTGFTTDWYDQLANDPDMLGAIGYSFQVAAIAVIVAVVFGCAFALDVALPLVMPGVVLGLSLLAFFREIGLDPGLVSVALGHAAFVMPIVLYIVLNRLRQLDPSLAQASKDCGAGPIRTFWHVTLPSIRVALLAAALLAFTLSFDEVTTTVFLAGSETTLPVFVWNLLRFGFTPEVNAVFSLIAVASVILIVVSSRLLSRQSRSTQGSATANQSLPVAADPGLGRLGEA
jgi:ABC-type spermidine/putrescine transport system permease subunit II